MMAVTTFVSTRPALRTAIRFGARWGVGHSVTVLTVGTIVILTGFRLPAQWNTLGEAGVGLMLVVVGLWAIRTTLNLHLHPPVEHGNHLHLHTHRTGRHHHAHAHAHSPPPTIPHGHGTTVVGLIHGLAGTTGAVALIPVTLFPSRWWGIAFLLAFSVGVIAAMTTYALVAALAIRQVGGSSVTIGRRVSVGIGLVGVSMGLWWIARAIWSG